MSDRPMFTFQEIATAIDAAYYAWASEAEAIDPAYDIPLSSSGLLEQVKRALLDNSANAGKLG